MVMVASNNHLLNICDDCFTSFGGWGARVGPKGRIRAAADLGRNLVRCNGCKVVKDCSKVSGRLAYPG
jgi:hypothetical protein